MRIINIVLTEIVNDRLKEEEQLQRLINSTDDINDCVNRIKLSLEKIVLLDEMINKWKIYTSTVDNVDDNK